MILRRVTEHVRAQNWFAVLLDLLVVVTGVFLGLQVTQWNEGIREQVIFAAEDPRPRNSGTLRAIIGAIGAEEKVTLVLNGGVVHAIV